MQPELWGGIECSINRVGNDYSDQLHHAGHYSRPADIAQIAALGFQKLRYPVLWERHQPRRDSDIDWSFATERLSFIPKAGITPVTGLVHHGSGPEWISFFDGSFEQGLAAYAGKVARQFPWLEYFTPVNEPLTTARFCGLYGHWFPHRSDDRSFARILYSECKAVTLSMQAIRKINPAAKLVQTEDLCKVYSTPLLRYQADFENERRWLPFDLLCGKVDHHHPLRHYLLRAGLNESELAFFTENPEPDYILGLNHYVTSERFLDEHLSHYPLHMHGGNGRHAYADVEAVRVAHGRPGGLKALLEEAWQRFGMPMAITEAHLNCSEEEQLRWFADAWQSCCALRESGVDIRAVTAWALLGAFGWDNLLRRPGGACERGVFSLRDNALHSTMLTDYIRHIAAGNAAPDIALKDGWWKRAERILYRPLLAKTRALQSGLPLQEAFEHALAAG